MQNKIKILKFKQLTLIIYSKNDSIEMYVELSRK